MSQEWSLLPVNVSLVALNGIPNSVHDTLPGNNTSLNHVRPDLAWFEKFQEYFWYSGSTYSKALPAPQETLKLTKATLGLKHQSTDRKQVNSSKMNLNQITLEVTDLDRSIKFYQTLGLILIVSSGNPYARFELPDGDATLSLHVVEESSRAGGVRLYFEVPDVAARVSELESAGIKFETQATDQRWLWTEAWLTDPDGHRLCVFHAGENRKNPPWRL